jgi:hypothetical protein
MVGTATCATSRSSLSAAEPPETPNMILSSLTLA